MPASTFTPDITVEIAFGSGYATPAGSRVWTDVSAYVEAQHEVEITRGRSDEFGEVNPSTLSLTLDNRDGRFTPEYASGAYYPNVKKGVPIRVSATWPLSGGTTYRRFTGYVDEWGIEWADPGAQQSLARITASSRMARLGRTAPLRSPIENEILLDRPRAYYPLSEPAGAVFAASVASTRQNPLSAVQRGSGGTITFGAGTGPVTDSLTAPVFDPSSDTSGKYLRTTIDEPIAPVPATMVALECWFNTSTANSGQIIELNVGNGLVEGLAMRLNSFTGGTLRAFAYSAAGSSTTDTGVTVDDGLTHHAVLRVEALNATQVTASLWLDGTLRDSDVITWTNSGGAPTFPHYDRLNVGGSASTDTFEMFDGTIAHVVIYGQDSTLTDARILAHHDAGATGYEGDSSGQWVEHVATWAGVPASEVDAGTGSTSSMAIPDASGRAPVEVLQDITRTENGLLFDAGDGTLTFHGRDHRYGATSVVTLSAASHNIDAGLQPVLDDERMTNDITATGVNGYTVRVINADSIDDHGTYADDTELLTTNDYEVDDYANWMVNLYGEPSVRVPNASTQVVVLPSATITALLALELGDKITLAGLPSQAPATSMDFFVEGYTERLGPESWRMSFNLSPGEAGDVFIIGDPVYGAIDAFPLAY